MRTRHLARSKKKKNERSLWLCAYIFLYVYYRKTVRLAPWDGRPLLWENDREYQWRQNKNAKMSDITFSIRKVKRVFNQFVNASSFSLILLWFVLCLCKQADANSTPDARFCRGRRTQPNLTWLWYFETNSIDKRHMRANISSVQMAQSFSRTQFKDDIYLRYFYNLIFTSKSDSSILSVILDTVNTEVTNWTGCWINYPINSWKQYAHGWRFRSRRAPGNKSNRSSPGHILIVLHPRCRQRHGAFLRRRRGHGGQPTRHPSLLPCHLTNRCHQRILTSTTVHKPIIDNLQIIRFPGPLWEVKRRQRRLRRPWRHLRQWRRGPWWQVARPRRLPCRPLESLGWLETVLTTTGWEHPRC